MRFQPIIVHRNATYNENAIESCLLHFIFAGINIFVSRVDDAAYLVTIDAFNL